MFPFTLFSTRKYPWWIIPNTSMTWELANNEMGLWTVTLKAPRTLIDKHEVHRNHHLPKPRINHSETCSVELWFYCLLFPSPSSPLWVLCGTERQGTTLLIVTLLKKTPSPSNYQFQNKVQLCFFPLGLRGSSPSTFLIAEFTGMCHAVQLLRLILIKEAVSTK